MTKQMEKLTLKLEADTASFKKKIDDAARHFDKVATRIERRMARLEKRARKAPSAS